MFFICFVGGVVVVFVVVVVLFLCMFVCFCLFGVGFCSFFLGLFVCCFCLFSPLFLCFFVVVWGGGGVCVVVCFVCFILFMLFLLLGIYRYCNILHLDGIQQSQVQTDSPRPQEL